MLTVPMTGSDSRRKVFVPQPKVGDYLTAPSIGMLADTPYTDLEEAEPPYVPAGARDPVPFP